MNYSQMIQDALCLLALVALCGVIAVPLHDVLFPDEDDDDDDFYGFQ